jgi:hypothetical protein
LEIAGHVENTATCRNGQATYFSIADCIPSPSDGPYNLTLETYMSTIPHTDSTLTVEISSNGGGWQDLPDEGVGIENLRVTLIPEPGTVELIGLGGALLAVRRRLS